MEEAALSKRGTVWSCTDGRYGPPPPYVSDPDVPWTPYTLVAVELAAERMVVLGQAAPGVGVADLDVAVLGAGMHPWGRRFLGFVAYGRIAARAALADAGIGWPEIRPVVGAQTVRGGYPGYVAGATFAGALGWQGARVASVYAACASGARSTTSPPRWSWSGTRTSGCAVRARGRSSCAPGRPRRAAGFR
ncbi:hypothetical protein GCM10010253_55090 [Streptomyces badius]|uniref:Beta-ketoacyl synthase N-terminal domain-containing protein n=1 Tax=Streptomyces badius TaxID=1941 RepID=A0ABQ2TM80_STRBA|nr:hypothetical protein GCM10010253_55090 [Streptomyces badius]